MKLSIKKVFLKLPNFLKKTLLRLRENYYEYISIKKESQEYGREQYPNKLNNKKIKNVLVYHISGLSFAGTEKNLQGIANNICDEYNVFFMHSKKGLEKDREKYINKNIKLIEFNYESVEQHHPYFIHGMAPHIKKIVKDNDIDLIITAGSGYTYYPINTIDNIPIIMINIFGTPTLQKNIVKNIFISDTVKKYSEQFTGPIKNNETLFIPVSNPPEESKVRGLEIRRNFSISNNDFVFGRIGRNADSIFDPIGIEAFKEVVKTNPGAHYIIMSPPPILEKMVNEEKIPNVHFLPPSADELDIWGFHHSLDAMAHFRNDGETFGLNIAESMRVGNPILSHRSHIWNAHIDYLKGDFSRIVGIGEIENYSKNMRDFILIKQNDPGKWQTMQQAAKNFANENFSEKKYTNEIKKIIKDCL